MLIEQLQQEWSAGIPSSEPLQWHRNAPANCLWNLGGLRWEGMAGVELVNVVQLAGRYRLYTLSTSRLHLLASKCCAA